MRAGTYQSPAGVYDVQIAGEYGYVVDGTNGLLVLNIANPANPFYAGSYRTNLPPDRYGNPGGISTSLALVGGYVYATGDGLRIFDVSDPYNPIRLSGFTGLSIFNICVSGHLFYLSYSVPGPSHPYGFVVVADVSEPANPAWVGRPPSPADCWNQTGIAAVGKTVYIVGNCGLRVYEAVELPFIRSIARNGSELLIKWNGMIPRGRMSRVRRERAVS
jgi:hypothetical protein